MWDLVLAAGAVLTFGYLILNYTRIAQSGGRISDLELVIAGVALVLVFEAARRASEGGFTPEEAEAAREAGFAVCAMGPRILRCETSPLIPLTAILYETGNLD